MRKLDLVGRKFGRLTVLSYAGSSSRGQAQWLVRCDCGSGSKVVYGTNLMRMQSTSCGCLALEIRKVSRRTHGQTSGKHPSVEYTAWISAKRRCSDRKNRWWKWYGARGIRMCPAWENSFQEFFLGIGPRPGPGYTLDRIDNDGNYEPGNVRWATWVEQANNRRAVTTHGVVLDGVDE